jgi:chorismate synthase
MKNTFGSLFQLHTFGESHGLALGAFIDGMPSGIAFRGDILVQDLQRRRPGFWGLTTNTGTSPRQEPDVPELLSGVYQGLTLGTPIVVIVRNQDQRSHDYDNLTPRRGHGDGVWKAKFDHWDPRGGGRSSGRETLSRVIGGSFAKMLLQQMQPSLSVKAYASELGPYKLTADEVTSAPIQNIDSFVGRFPSANQQESLEKDLRTLQAQGDSWSGVADIVITSLPVGLGQPVFHKLKNDLANALTSIGGVCGLHFGLSLDLSKKGSEFHSENQTYGGLQGGLSNGYPVTLKVFFKPTASILDVAKKGRHDPCIVIRAIPVLEAMVYLVLADHFLWQKLDRGSLL